MIERLRDWGLGGLEAYYVTFDGATRAAVARVAAEHGLLATGGSDYHGDTWTYAQAQGTCHVPDEAGDALLAALGMPPLRGQAPPRSPRQPGARRPPAPRSRRGAPSHPPARLVAMAARQLPVLDLVPRPALTPRRPALAPERLDEFVTDDLVLPRFHVWTLGCQMNQSDSEEMAGALLAAGCPEASSMEEADLIVINSCAIRETAEAKIVGRQGHLARLKAANPGLRVVLTGCAVRVENRDRLARRYPAVDLFLRPDEEPELAARLGLASATAAGLFALPAEAPGVGQAPFAAAAGGAAAHQCGGRRCTSRDPRGRGRRRARGAPQHDPGMAAHHLRLRQDLHLLHRAVQPRARSGAARSTTW